MMRPGGAATSKASPTYPVQLSVPNQLVYSIHEYGPEIASQFWFFASNFPNNLPALWDKRFGYVAEQNTAPVWVGEFGGPEYDASSTPKEIAWETKFISYIEAHQLPWSFWDLNPNSSGTGGILENDWTTVDPFKLGLLSPLLAPPPALVSAVSRKPGAPAGRRSSFSPSPRQSSRGRALRSRSAAEYWLRHR